MKARVHVMLKHGVLDPQGKAIAHALGSLGFGGVNEVRQGKVIDLDLVEDDPNRARAAVESMCQQLLAGTSIRRRRSEEHTSELQSHLNLVCRLLLEKKKKKNKQYVSNNKSS